MEITETFHVVIMSVLTTYVSDYMFCPTHFPHGHRFHAPRSSDMSAVNGRVSACPPSAFQVSERLERKSIWECGAQRRMQRRIQPGTRCVWLTPRGSGQGVGCIHRHRDAVEILDNKLQLSLLIRGRHTSAKHGSGIAVEFCCLLTNGKPSASASWQLVGNPNDPNPQP
jgi:hypothetical protein